MQFNHFIDCFMEFYTLTSLAKVYKLGNLYKNDLCGLVELNNSPLG